MVVARPILFSAPMVRALLDGRKSQTRRIVKPQPQRLNAAEFNWKKGLCSRDWMAKQSPYGKPGDLPWVRESHAIVGNTDPGWVIYRASGYENECRRHGFDRPCTPESEITWKPSIYMHRWASRLTLRIVDVRVELLQEISGSDCIAEGIEPHHLGDAREEASFNRSDYSELWDRINGDDAWEANPWVWAIRFDVLKQNVDAITRAAS